MQFGFTEARGKMTADEQRVKMSTQSYCGLDGTEGMARWLWNQHFAAIASDNLAVEAMPPIVHGETHSLTQRGLHQGCLSLFGMPLGELWYLKDLAKQCMKYKKYTFFLTCSPLNVSGAVGSPLHALELL